MAEASANQASTATKTRLKRPLFTKPAWAQEDKSSSSTDFFRRSNQNYAHITAQAERKRQRRLARKQRERAGEDTHLERAEKRQRISSDSDLDEDSDHSSSDDLTVLERKQKEIGLPAAKPKVEKQKRSLSPSKFNSSPKSLGNKYGTELVAEEQTTSRKLLPSNIIDLGDEDDPLEAKEDETVVVTSVKRSEPPPEDDDFPPSDDEFAELTRKAREKARKRLEADVLSPTPDPSTSRTQDSQINGAKPVHEPTPAPAAPDPAVAILITSRITNTIPLIVNRRVSQRLKDVRITWCQRQGFTPETTATVFLTWRGNRLFDVTTCKSLGIGVDFDGNIVMKGQKDILGEEERQIHMEAMTEEIFEEYQKMKRREAEGVSHQETDTERGEPPAVEKKEPQVRIILKAKGYDDFKLIVKPVRKQIFLHADENGVPDRFHLDNQNIEDRQCFQVRQEDR
ncbi:MAG: hypothetical protein Q9225_000085 [Loekoesia sp. 1 TL-2023]